MSRANPAVEQHLRQIADQERTRTVRWMVRVRALIATLYTLQILYYVVVEPQPDARRTLPLFIVYTVLAGVVAVLVEVDDRLARPAGYTLGLLDLPVITGAVSLAIPMSDNPTYLVYSALSFSTLLIMATILTLDAWAIVTAAVLASIGNVYIVRAVGAPWVEAFDPFFGTVASGGLALFIVARVRAFITESRRKDFAGKYVLDRRLGVGGMAEVFSAMYSPEGGFERRVAVKRVLPAFANNEEYMALFRREAELSARLHHPNLVQVFDFGRHLDSYFLAMEFVDGVSLSAFMPPRAALPLDAALYVIGELAEALTYLHERTSAGGAVGLVHRDFNPPNILLSTAGEVKVTDFGIARWADSDSLTREGAVRGKLPYLAPELLKGAAPEPAADLFALGVMAFELLLHRRLFGGQTEQATVTAILEGALPSLSRERPDLPADLTSALEQLLARDPAQRPRSARLITSRLRALEGPLAPYPQGRASLARAIESLAAAR